MAYFLVLATYIKYQSIYDKHIRRKLASFPVSELDEDIIAGLFQKEGMKPLSESLKKVFLAC